MRALSFALTVLLLARATALAGSVPDATPTPTPEAAPEVTPAIAPDPVASPSPAPIPPETESETETAAEAEEEAESDLEADAELSDERPKKVWLATLMSVIPGMGQMYMEEPARGFAFIGAEAAWLGAAVVTVQTSGYDPEDPTDTRANRALLPLAWWQNTHFLSMYDAWRLARVRNADRYRTPVPTPGTERLLLAPFSGRQLLRPVVMVPLAAVWGIGIGVASQAEGGEAKFHELEEILVFSREVDRWTALGVAGGYYSATFWAVGIGEEALFRGVVQTSLEERLGPTWGWVTASLFFGLIHAANGTTASESAIAVGATTIIGGYLGWLYQRDGYDLTGATFFHTWYDVGIGITTFLLDPEHQPFTMRFAIPF